MVRQADVFLSQIVKDKESISHQSYRALKRIRKNVNLLMAAFEEMEEERREAREWGEEGISRLFK